MSTDPTPAEDSRTGRRRSREYRRAIVATVGVLALATAGLGIAGAFRGPHLDSATAAAASALERPGQRIVLQADQAIRPIAPDDVRMTPAVPFEAESDGAAVTIRLTGMLDALTDYRVEVDVVGASTGVASTLAYAFTTPDLEVAVLVRDPDGADEVRVRGVSGGDPVTLFAADRIQEFALTSDAVAAVLLDADDTARLVLAPMDGGIVQDIALPEPGRVTQLRASGTTGRIGFVFTAADASDADAPVSRLQLYDPADPSGVPRPVAGLDGAPLSVIDWLFVPGTTALVAHAFGDALLLVDSVPDAVPAPLGEHAELRGLLPGTLRLVVADLLSGSTIDLETGRTEVLELPPDDLAPDVYPGTVLAIAEDRYVELVSRPVPGESFALDYAVLLVDADGARTVYETSAGASVRDICLAPNAQYVAVEVQDAGSAPDGYPVLAAREGITTYFVDLATGSARRGLVGFASTWCS